MTQNARQLAAKFEKASSDLKAAPRNGVFQAALVGKALFVAEAGAKGLAPTSRIARGRWSVGFDIKGTTNPTALVKFRGPVHLVNNPTKAHEITPRGRRRGAKRALATPHGVFARVQHPGTRGKRFFESGRPKVRKAASEVFERTTRVALTKNFGR